MSGVVVLENPGEFKSALFVDFDNIYLSLRKLDEHAAEAFATEPISWVSALVAGEGLIPSGTSVTRRRLLIQNMYFNPKAFSRYRAAFTRSGFRVVDCPPLTGLGKNSADIYMALDIIDALQSSVHYDEFVIASADADFTPVLYRLRSHDRRITLLSAGLTAAAYRAVCDIYIAPERLADISLGEGTQLEQLEPVDDMPSMPSTELAVAAPGIAGAKTTGASVERISEEEIRQATAAVYRAVATSERPIVSAAAAQAALSASPRLKETNWAGTGSFKAFTTVHLKALSYDSSPPAGWVYDPNRHLAPAASEASSGIEGSLIGEISVVTGAPRLDTAHYGALFRALADDLAEAPYHRNETTKRVRTRTELCGLAVPRSAVNYVLQGLLYAGQRLTGDVSARELAGAWAANVKYLAWNAERSLTADDERAIDSWIAGDLDDGATAASAAIDQGHDEPTWLIPEE